MKFEKTLQASLVNLQSFGRLYFTPKQLYYEFCRTLRLPFAIDLRKSLPIFDKVSSLMRTPQTIETPASWNEFGAKFAQYLKTNEITGLLKIESKIDFVEKFPSDLTLYGLPKILICESDEIAQMLRANQFHLQTPCGVLSLSEASPLPTGWQKMLGRAENPQAYFLHDASLRAFSVIKNLRQTLRIKDDVLLRPLGLRPVHAQRLRLFSIKADSRNLDLSELNYLSDEEKNWLLDGNSVEISAVSPIRLLRILRRIILGLEIPTSDWQLKLPSKSMGFM